MVALLYFLLLIYCFSVQYNDSDAVLWMFLYGCAALSVLPFLFRRPQPALAMIVLCVGGTSAVLWAFLCWPFNEEEMREVGGLILITIGHFGLYLGAKKGK